MLLWTKTDILIKLVSQHECWFESSWALFYSHQPLLLDNHQLFQYDDDIKIPTKSGFITSFRILFVTSPTSFVFKTFLNGIFFKILSLVYLSVLVFPVTAYYLHVCFSCYRKSRSDLMYAVEFRVKIGWQMEIHAYHSSVLTLHSQVATHCLKIPSIASNATITQAQYTIHL